jgi:hypothetical protein
MRPMIHLMLIPGAHPRLVCCSDGGRLLASIQGIAGNKEGEFKVEAQFLSKSHTNNAYFFLKLLLKGT